MTILHWFYVPIDGVEIYQVHHAFFPTEKFDKEAKSCMVNDM
jgi:hypothetical protein